MRPSVTVPVLVLFLCTRVVITEAKLQQQATIDVSEEDEDDDDYDYDHSRPEIDDDGRIYKNPRNSPSAMCPRDENQAKLLGQKCLRKCSTDEDCKSTKKKCRCDGICGMSCVKPEKLCPELAEIPHGKMRITGNFFSNIVQYTCDDDYFIVGIGERICRGDGTWSGTVPACKKDSNSFCIDPPKIANARNSVPLEQTTFDLEATVQYYCDHGYETIGFQEAKCLRMDGKVSWFGPDITCSPKSCGPPTDIANGWHAGECYTYDCRVSYHCADGHELVGKSEKVCLADGTWAPKELPQCVQVTAVQCPLPDHPTNGKAIYTSYAYNAIVSYECRYGYVLVGQATRKCQADRKWSGQSPACKEIDCGSPGILYNGWIEGIDAGTGLGASIIFRCDTHMKLEGNTSSVCQKDGKWRYPLPHCLAPCIIPQIEKGHITVDTKDTSPDHINNVTVVEHGERLRVFCIKNYEFAQNNTPVVCNNGTWSIIPSCSPARCKQLPKTPKNGMVIAPKMNHGMKAVFKCKDGFVLIGGGPKNDSFHVECHYGTWIGHIPHCEEVYCAFPGYVENGKVLLVGNMGVYDYRPYVKKVPNNKQIMYDCNKGYVLSEGPPGATCVGGHWSPKELPACRPGQHPRIRWSRRKRSIDDIQSDVNSTTNFKKFIEFFRRVGKKLLHMELEKAQEAEKREFNSEDAGNFTITPLSLIDHKVLNTTVNATDEKSHFNQTTDSIFVRKKHQSNHRNKSRNKDDKMIDFLRIVYRKLKRIDSRRNNTGVNTTMHELLNLMSKNFFHVDLNESRRNTSKNHDNLQLHNQHEFTKLKREFERIMKFYNKSLRWSEKHNKKLSKRRKTDTNVYDNNNNNNNNNNKIIRDKKRKKIIKSKNYYRGFYEFINGYVNEKLSILDTENGTEELMKKMNIDKFNIKNGTTFTVGEIYAFFKHIIDNKLHSDYVTIDDIKITTIVPQQMINVNDTVKTSVTTVDSNLDNEIPNSGNKSEIAKHRTKRIRNISEQTTDISHKNRKLLAIISPLSNTKDESLRDTLQLSKTKEFTLNGLDAQQQSRTKRFLTTSELDNQIFLKNLYLNAYEDEYRANVRRSITQDNGRTNWTALRRRKGNLGHYDIK